MVLYIRDLGDNKELEEQEDNIRIYVPVNLNWKAILRRLEEIPDGCAETFPFELIEDLKREYFPD